MSIFKPQLGVKVNWSNPLSKGLIQCWLLNENAGIKTTDIASNKIGTLTNMANPASASSGWGVGKTLRFDGTNDYVSIPANTLYNQLLPASAVSIAARVYFTSFVTTEAGSNNIFGGWLTATLTLCSLNAQGTATTGTLRTASRTRATDGANLLTGSVLSVGQWYDLVAVHNWQANTFSLYVDGKLDATAGGTWTLPVTNGASTATELDCIGSIFVSGGNRWTNGNIDYVRVYNRALTASEVKELHINPYVGLVSKKSIFNKMSSFLYNQFFFAS